MPSTVAELKLWSGPGAVSPDRTRMLRDLQHGSVVIRGDYSTARRHDQGASVPAAVRESRTLVSLCTYNERDNLAPLIQEIHKVVPTADVLVVDDNADAADSLALLLKLFGHEAQAVHSGAAALNIVRSYQPQVILLDLSMPVLDGYQVARIDAAPEEITVLFVGGEDWNQPLGGVGELLERGLIARAVVGGRRLRNAVELDHDDPLVEPGLIGL